MLVDMDKVQVHPTGMVDPSDPSNISKFLSPEALRGSGALLVNRDGLRFANELGRRKYLTEQIQQRCTSYPTPLSSGKEQPVAYMILNKEVEGTLQILSGLFYLLLLSM